MGEAAKSERFLYTGKRLTNMAMLSVFIVAALFRLATTASVPTCSLDEAGSAEKVEVLILGAGISGVAAARTLEVNGVTDFLVLEASDRVGGRIRERDGTNIEVGANWIHGLDLSDPDHHPIWREWTACDQDGPGGSPTPDFTSVYDSDGNQIDIENGPFVTRHDAFLSAFDAVFELDAPINTSTRQGLTRVGWEAKDSLDNWFEWYYIDLELGVTPQKLSLPIYSELSTYTDFTESEDEDETDDYLVVDEKGFSFVVRCMARNFINDTIKLNSVVKQIKVAEDCVCAKIEGGGMYCGRYGIVTFSAGVLQAGIRGDENSVQFEPPLPQWKQDAINSITPVFYGKIFLVFSTRFWEETEEDQEILGYVSEERGYYAYYVLDKNRPNTITVDVTGNLTIRIATQSEEETVNEIMTILRKIFNNDSLPDPESSVISKWHLDPFYLHSYSTYGPGVPESIFEDLLKPVSGRLYFAGEALNSTNYGSTQGAYGTGVFAAQQYLGAGQ